MNLKTVKLLLTFFFLWITTQFGIDIENLLAYIFVLSLGVLHGSNDLKLIGNFSNEKKYTFRTKLSIYVFVVLFSFCLFLIFPSLGLILFIIFSGYHFGHLERFLALILKKVPTLLEAAHMMNMQDMLKMVKLMQEICHGS